ncbi:hypothetical protein BDR03DRAFT_947136 [Suillus americanus]|nr:hypothetical protein BDR03DRAFT_947136 [Suillus americanus]
MSWITEHALRLLVAALPVVYLYISPIRDQLSTFSSLHGAEHFSMICRAIFLDHCLLSGGAEPYAGQYVRLTYGI